MLFFGKKEMIASHKIYEQNFSRLMRLLPMLHDSEARVATEAVRVAEALVVQVLEHHKYTTVIRLTHDLPELTRVPQPVMTVRIYHDASVAEVLSYQHVSRFQPKYDYPNPNMHQIREKSRLNEFLGEWLEYCLSRGRSVLTQLSDIR